MVHPKEEKANRDGQGQIKTLLDWNVVGRKTPCRDSEAREGQGESWSPKDASHHPGYIIPFLLRYNSYHAIHPLKFNVPFNGF